MYVKFSYRMERARLANRSMINFGRVIMCGEVRKYNQLTHCESHGAPNNVGQIIQSAKLYNTNANL